MDLEPPQDEIAQQVQQAWAQLLSALQRAGYAVDELVRPPASAQQVAEAEEAIGRPLPRDLAALYQLADGQVEWIELVRERGANERPPRSRLAAMRQRERPAETRERGRWVGSLLGEGWSFDPLGRLRTEYRTWADVRATYTPAELAEEFDSQIESRGSDPVKPLYTSADWIPFATDGGGNSLAADMTPEPGGNVGQVIVIGSDEDQRRVLAPSVRALLELCTARLLDDTLVPYLKGGVALYPLELP